MHQKITEEVFHALIKSAQILPTNHIYHPISINWITIAEYRNHRASAKSGANLFYNSLCQVTRNTTTSFET